MLSHVASRVHNEWGLSPSGWMYCVPCCCSGWVKPHLSEGPTSLPPDVCPSSTTNAHGGGLPPPWALGVKPGGGLLLIHPLSAPDPSTCQLHWGPMPCRHPCGTFCGIWDTMQQDGMHGDALAPPSLRVWALLFGLSPNGADGGVSDKLSITPPPLALDYVLPGPPP